MCDGAGTCESLDFVLGTLCGAVGAECEDPDTCDGDGTSIDNGFDDAGTPCGDDATECSGQGRCDGAGTCEPNDRPVGTGCGDETDDDCTGPDTCDGAGVCDANDVSLGTACGDAGAECEVQDTCDGAGSCSDNGFSGAGSPCGDAGAACVVQDTYDAAGSCTDSGFVAPGTDCGDAATECSDQDTCDGAGVCEPNGLPDTTPCNDGLFCNGTETCTGAACGNSTGNPCSGQSCNEASNSCSSGGCSSDADCNDGNPFTNDNCNMSSGACSTTNKAVGASCPDDGDPLTDDFCDSGVCVHPVISAGAEEPEVPGQTPLSDGVTLATDGFGDDVIVDVSTDAEGNQTVVLEAADGDVVTLQLNSLPADSTVQVTRSASGDVTVSVTDPSGEVVDVTIEASGSGDDVVFTITYNSTSSGTTAKRFDGFPGFVDDESFGGSVTIEASGLAPGGAFTVLLGYEQTDVDDAAVDEAELRVQRLNQATGIYEPAGANDSGVGSPTGVIGDYGVDTLTNEAWVETTTLGTYAVGVVAQAPAQGPDLPPEQPEQPLPDDEDPMPSSGLCGLFGAITLPLTFMMLIGVRHRRRQRSDDSRRRS